MRCCLALVASLVLPLSSSGCGLLDDAAVGHWSLPREQPQGTYLSLAVGNAYGCGVRTDQTLSCWGYVRGTPPAGKFQSVSLTYTTACAVGVDGAIACWGSNWSGEGDAPSDGTFISVAVGMDHACAVTTEGMLRCWGSDGVGQTEPPQGRYVSVIAGNSFSCAVEDDGTVPCWGAGFQRGVFNLPLGPGSFKRIATQYSAYCGIDMKDTMSCRGFNFSGGRETEEGILSVGPGSSHLCAVRTDGTMSCWGDNNSGEASPPPGTYREVAAADFYTCAIRTDDTATCFGAYAPN